MTAAVAAVGVAADAGAPRGLTGAAVVVAAAVAGLALVALAGASVAVGGAYLVYRLSR